MNNFYKKYLFCKQFKSNVLVDKNFSFQIEVPQYFQIFIKNIILSQFIILITQTFFLKFCVRILITFGKCTREKMPFTCLGIFKY